MYIRPFEAQTPTVNLAVTTSSQTLAVNATPIGNRSIRLVNSGTATVFFKLGSSAVVTTTAAGTPLLPNTIEVFFLRNEDTHLALIASAAGSTLYATVGESA